MEIKTNIHCSPLTYRGTERKNVYISHGGENSKTIAARKQALLDIANEVKKEHTKHHRFDWYAESLTYHSLKRLVKGLCNDRVQIDNVYEIAGYYGD